MDIQEKKKWEEVGNVFVERSIKYKANMVIDFVTVKNTK